MCEYIESIARGLVNDEQPMHLVFTQRLYGVKKARVRINRDQWLLVLL